MTPPDDAVARLAEAMTKFGSLAGSPVRFYAERAIRAIAADPSILDGVVPGWGKLPNREQWTAMYRNWSTATGQFEHTVKCGYAVPDPILEAAPLPTHETMIPVKYEHLAAAITFITEYDDEGGWAENLVEAVQDFMDAAAKRESTT